MKTSDFCILRLGSSFELYMDPSISPNAFYNLESRTLLLFKWRDLIPPWILSANDDISPQTCEKNQREGELLEDLKVWKDILHKKNTRVVFIQRAPKNPPKRVFICLGRNYIDLWRLTHFTSHQVTFELT